MNIIYDIFQRRPDLIESVTNRDFDIYLRELLFFVNEAFALIQDKIDAEENTKPGKCAIIIFFVQDGSSFYLAYQNYSVQLVEEMKVLWGNTDASKFNDTLSNFLTSLNN